MERGKLVRNGLFLNVEGNKKTKFVKNRIFYKMIENDIVEYEVKNNGYILVKSIVERKPLSTIGIIKSYDEKEQEYIFHVPFLTQNYF